MVPKPNKKPINKDKKAVVPVGDTSRLTSDDIYLFNEGSHFGLYDKMGAHPDIVNGEKGFHFAVWAPDAKYASVIGDFNGWNRKSHPLQPLANSGIWEGFLPGFDAGVLYKYFIESRYRSYRVEKSDPFAFHSEVPPKTASVSWDLSYEWHDADWLAQRQASSSLAAPISVYEVHAGSWRRVPEENNRSLTYRELAVQLTEYLLQTGFTHVEFLPLMEHPFFGSWGYQTTGYFAPTSRYGTPQDFMYLVDYLHQHGIGVIMDWVPSHFPNDEHGLGLFDGTHLYEHADPQKGFHPDWKSYIFNYGRKEIQSFLISVALFWLDKYHIDGLRTDAVASMIYLDYSRKKGEWIPNKYGGRENLEAIAFLKRFNEEVYRNYPGVQTFAEESTAWPMVSRPTYVGGLGFGFKWDMGWMHDTLQYISKDPIHRKYHHNELTFRALYAFSENYILPLSHDEVVYGKGSLLGKMPGDDWQKFANLRLLLGYMYAEPGKKLLFMGGELAQWNEWAHDGSLDWKLLAYERHAAIRNWVTALNNLYRNEPALYQQDCEPAGFEWIDASDSEQSIISFIRKGDLEDSIMLAVCNFTPQTHNNYRIGVSLVGNWMEALNSDAAQFGGSGQGNPAKLSTDEMPFHGRPYSINITVPPLAVIFLKYEAASDEQG